MDSFPHLPVLADPVRQAFADLPATLGGGAHSALLLADPPALQLIGLDQDPAAPPLLRALAPLAGGGGRNGAGGGNR